MTRRRRVPSNHRPVTLGEFAGIPTALTIAGAGAQKAIHGLRAIREAFPVSAVAICGVAGGLDPSLRVGDVVLASEVRDATSQGAPLRPHPGPAPTALLRGAPVVSVPNVLINPQEKRALAPGGAAADLETAAAAAESVRLGLPWCALRALSDAAGDLLPLDFNRCVAADGDIPLVAILRELARHPAALPGMIRLGRDTSLAARRLAEAAAEYLPAWYRAALS